MMNAFWIVVRIGPSPSDEIWYLDQLRSHFADLGHVRIKGVIRIKGVRYEWH